MIGIYMQTKMSVEQYQEINARVLDAQLDITGLVMHCAFGESGSVALFDVWESKAAFEAFAAHLGPIFAALGVEPVAPDFVEMIDYQAAPLHP
ncbi:MAG TPA: hypothetical protein VMU99_06105 [Acidimicrobiales bacterium]|nr:hypothetical protein [Acidimicrobiales bacterium]